MRKTNVESIAIFEGSASVTRSRTDFHRIFSCSPSGLPHFSSRAVPRRRIMAEWHRSRGQGRSATARRPPGRDPCDLRRIARARRAAAQTRSENHTLLAGRCRADRSVAQINRENAEICAIQPTTSRTHTGAVSIPPAHGGRGGTVAKRDQRRATRKHALAGEAAGP